MDEHRTDCGGGIVSGMGRDKEYTRPAYIELEACLYRTGGWNESRKQQL